MSHATLFSSAGAESSIAPNAYGFSSPTDNAVLAKAESTTGPFNSNDFLLTAENQSNKNIAIQSFLETIQVEKIINKLTTKSLNNPDSAIARTLADHFSALPQEQQAPFLQQVTQYMQTTEYLKVLRNTFASILDQHLDLASIQSLTSFFSQHRVSLFMKFQQALAKAIANSLLHQPVGQTYTCSTITPEHQQAARNLLSTLLAIRKSENVQLLTLVNTANLISLVTPLCCFYLDRTYLQDLTTFIQTSEGVKIILRYEQIERSLYDALVTWCNSAIQAVQSSVQSRGTLPCAVCSHVSYSICMSAPSNTTSLWGEFKTICSTIMDKAEEKIKYVCSTLEKLYLRRFSQTNQTSFKRLVSIAGETFDQCMQDAGVTQGNTAITIQGIALQPSDYQNIKSLVKTECSGACQEISTTLSCSQNSSKDRLIDELFELSKFNIIKMLIILIVTQAKSAQGLEKEKIEQKVTRLMKQLIATNFTESEISELITFFKSPAFQRILQHADEFIQLVLDNLSPEITNLIQRIFPWHTIL